MSLVQIRKRNLTIETVFHEGGPAPAQPLRLGASSAVIRNPYTGRFEPDLLPFMAELRDLGRSLATELAEALGGPERIEAYDDVANALHATPGVYRKVYRDKRPSSDK